MRLYQQSGLLLSLILLSSAGFGQVVAPPVIDDGSLDAFMDGIVYASMEDNKIAGVVIAVTHNNQVIFQKGYGFADVDAKIPVDPATTLFRIGSVSKLFTWTALMQLREAGKIDFDSDVNDYLKSLKIPESFPEPITVHHLMTHTGGFEERLVKLFGHEPAVMRSYAEILDAQLPTRVRRPGEVSSYSNHGVGVAGLLVEDVSGMSWNDYIEENILHPLDMTAATGRQPVPDALAADLSNGYAYEEGRYVEKDYEYVPLGAVGGMSASALAMSRFARAHLNGGEFNGVRILGEGATLEMRQPLFARHDAVNPWLYGFADYSRAGIFIYGHSGGTLRFFTEFALIPKDNVSLFVSTNTTNGSRVNNALFGGFLDRYYPGTPSEPDVTAITNAEEIIGSWASFRSPLTTPDKLLRVFQPVTVKANSENELMITGLAEHPTYWSQIAPYVFQRSDPETRLVFDTSVEPNQMLVGSELFSFYKISALESPGMQAPLVIISLGLFLWVLIAWPVQRLKRRGSLDISSSRARAVGWTQALIVFIVVGLWSTASEEVVFGLPVTLSLALWIGCLIPLLAAGQLLFTARVWVSDVSWSAKSFHSLLVAAALFVSWLLYYWNLLGPYRW